MNRIQDAEERERFDRELDNPISGITTDDSFEESFEW